MKQEKASAKTASVPPADFRIKRDRLSDQVARSLESMILSGEIPMGEALPSERDLMERYGVGRPAVREALLWLNKKGFIGLHSGARARVTEPNPKNLLEQLSGAASMLVQRPEGMHLFQQTRLFTEVALAREVARIAKPDDVLLLGRLLDANKASTDLQTFASTDDDFHFGIASLLHNPLLTALYHSVLEVLQDQRHTSLDHPEARDAAVGCHERIFEAIRDHDPERAEQEMRRHLGEVEEYYWAVRKPTAGPRRRVAGGVDDLPL